MASTQGRGQAGKHVERVAVVEAQHGATRADGRVGLGESTGGHDGGSRDIGDYSRRGRRRRQAGPPFVVGCELCYVWRHRVGVIGALVVLHATVLASGVAHESGTRPEGGRATPIRLRPGPALGAAPAARPVPRVPAPRLRAQAAIILDPVTGETLWERNSHELRSIASITKVMTVIALLGTTPGPVA